MIARVFGENCPHFAATCTKAGKRVGERERQRDQSTEKYKWGGDIEKGSERVIRSRTFDLIFLCVCAEQ